MQVFEVVGYTLTGIYCQPVMASTKEEAMKIGKPKLLKELRPVGKIKRWAVREA